MTDDHDLVAAYAIEALDDLERARFERHLAACDQCTAELAELQDAAALLAEAEATTPPTSLRDQILAEVAASAPTTTTAYQSAEATRSRRVPRWMLGAVAAAVLLVGGGVVYTAMQPEAPTLSAADRVLAADDATSGDVTLDGGGTVRLTVSDSLGQAVVTTDDLPAPPAGNVYELWLMAPDGSVAPAGFVALDEPTVLDGDASAAIGAAISVEPDGGSDQPTTTPIAVIEFSALS